MKKRFLSVLLTLFMVLMMLPTTAYADTAYCDICGKEVDIDYSNYEYLTRAISSEVWLLPRMWFFCCEATL